MESKNASLEFDAEIDHEGKITVPPSVRDRLNKEKLHVRVSTTRMESKLRDRGVTEDEIRTIAATQLEPQEQVVKFLLTEGVLKRRPAFRQRGRR